MRFALPFACILLVACSSSESTPQTADTGSDVGEGIDTGEGVDTGSADSSETSVPVTCGSAPYVTWSGKFSELGISGTSPPTNVQITSPGCPGSTFTTAADGSFSIQIQKGLTSYIRVKADATIPAIVGQSVADADSSGIDLTLLPALFKGFISSWGAGEPAILVKLSAAKGATGACADLSGVTISVKDQPSAKVSYFDNGSPPMISKTATTTSASGIVAITGVTGTLVEVVAAKTGCTLAPVSPLNGKTALEPDFLTEAGLTISN